MGDDVTCSWRPQQHDGPPPLTIHDDVRGATAQAEAAAAARVDGDATAAVALDGAATAPWMTVRLRRRARHLVVVSNARVLEVHVGDTTVHTHEGVAAAAAGLFLHNVECDAAAGQTLKLKFFARKTKLVLDVAAVCLVCDAAAPVGDETNEAALPTVESRLRELELLMHSSMMMVMHRLSDVESRLGVLERREGL